MDDRADAARVIIRPPLAWGLAVIAGLALNWLVPLPLLPADLPAGGLGAMVFVLALALFAWAIAFDNFWLLMMLVPFALVIRYGVVTREEAYLERKFGDVYRGYRSRVRRWL